MKRPKPARSRSRWRMLGTESLGYGRSELSNDEVSEFGGMCFAGHDVPKGAHYCPRCGAPAVQTGDPTPECPPPGVWNGASGYRPSSQRPAPPGGSPTQHSVPLVPPPLVPPPPYGRPFPAPPLRTPGGMYENQPGWGPPTQNSPGPAWGYYPAADRLSALRRDSNGLALASLAFGALWIFWFGSLVAVLLGHLALYQIRHNNRFGRHQTGTGAAVVGLVLGYVGLAILAITVIAGVSSSAAGFY